MGTGKKALFGLFLCIAAFSSVVHAQQISNPFEKKEQLQPGKTAGTYVFSYSAAIEFSQEPAFPVNFTIADYAHKPVFQFPVNDSKTFTISTELAPGGYWINSRVLPDKATTYWDSSSVSLFVDQSGKATINEFPLGIRHLKKMTTLSPSNASIVSDKRPLLRWTPLPGAVSYRVQWLEENAPFKVVSRGSGETKATELQITEDVIAERQYEWSVDAIGDKGQQIGYWSASYFFTPGGKEAFAKAPMLNPKPAKGTPYIGINPIKLLSKDEPQGIRITSVGANSPAMKAGLQPEDMLISLDGKPLDAVSVTEFVNMIRSMGVRAEIAFEYIRQGEKKSVKVMVEGMP